MLANVMDVGKCEVSLKNACKTFSSGVATNEIKKNGNFKLAGMLNLKLKKKAATPAMKGINPFTKEPTCSKQSQPPRL